MSARPRFMRSAASRRAIAVIGDAGRGGRRRSVGVGESVAHRGDATETRRGGEAEEVRRGGEAENIRRGGEADDVLAIPRAVGLDGVSS